VTSSGRQKRAVGRGDALALAALVTASAAIAWPILSGGWQTYLDNPAHLAEIASLAGEARHGWSDLAWCGYPLGALHSPLWFGSLALLDRWGIPLGAPYAACVWLGFTAPALALYAVARRRLTPLAAALGAYLLLVQRPALVGFGSAPGGMWTYTLGCAGVILLAGVLARREPPRRETAWVGGLVALVGLTHAFAAVAAGVLFAGHAILALARGPAWRARLGRQTLGATLGAAASAVYWGPLLFGGDALTYEPEFLPALDILRRLVLPGSVLDLIEGRRAVDGTLLYTDILPMLVLVGAGAAALARRGRLRDDGPAAAGLVLAGAMLLLVTVVGPFLDARWLGHVPWRHVYVVRVGLALAALPVLAGWAERAPALLRRSPGATALAVAAAALGLWWGRPLALQTLPPGGEEMDDVRAVWSWLADHRDEIPGRLYVQDTFYNAVDDASLARSHVLARTAPETGCRQLGALYAGSPFRTVAWTMSEFALVFGEPLLGDEQLIRAVRLSRVANCTHWLISSAHLADKLEPTQAGLDGRWVEPLGEGADVSGVEYATGRVEMDVRVALPGARLLVKSAHAPAWRLDGPAGARLERDRLGLLNVTGLPAGSHHLVLEYRTARWVRWLSLAAGLAIFLLALRPPSHPRGSPSRRG
jgi:hypothetical protein